MQSNVIKKMAEELMNLANDDEYMSDPVNREKLNARIGALNVLTLNEVNWTLYYVKEELKTQSNIMRMQRRAYVCVEMQVLRCGGGSGADGEVIGVPSLPPCISHIQMP